MSFRARLEQPGVRAISSKLSVSSFLRCDPVCLRRTPRIRPPLLPPEKVVRSSAMQDFEKLGLFYLGRDYDVAAKNASMTPVLYDSRDLVTHAVCVGMTGSGKTGLCMSLIEEAAIDGVPVIAIDPKGDLGNLLLTFPQLSAGGFPSLDRRGRSATAGPDRRRLRRRQAENGGRAWRIGARTGRASSGCADAADFTIYTPGSRAGLPVSILQSFAAPPPRPRDDAEAAGGAGRKHGDKRAVARRRRRSAPQPRAHARRRACSAAWADGRDLDLAALIQQVQTPPFRSRRRRSRVLLPGEGPLRPGDASQRAAGGARVSSSGSKASRSTRRTCSTRRRASRGSPFSPSRTSGTRSGCSSSRCCSTRSWRGCARRPGRRACARSLHGRNPRLLSAGRESALEGTAADAAQAGPRVRPRRRARDPEPGRPRLQGAGEHRHVVPGPAADRARQGAHARRARRGGGRLVGSRRDG